MFAKRTDENIIPMYRQQLIGIGNASNKRGATHTQKPMLHHAKHSNRQTDRPTEEQESNEQENHRKEHFIAILTNT